MMVNSKLSFEQLITLYPEQIWLEISPDDRATAEQETAAHRYTNDAARDRALQNTLCLKAMQALLAEEPDLPPSQIWLEPNDRAAVWELVNGSALTVGNTRLALIPTDPTDFDLFKVEQEWIDLPEWAAHAYLAVQLNMEDNWLRVLGYATHDQLKQPENYSSHEQVYCLKRSRLIGDLNVLWISREVSPDWNPIVAPLPELSNAPNLIEQLSQVTAYSPRLERSFAQWSPLIANPTWRRSLYQQRLDYVSLIAHLSRWLQKNFVEPRWQVIQDWANFPQLATARARSSEQTRRRSINLGQHTVDLIVALETVEASSDLGVTLILQRPEPTPLPAALRLALAEQTATEVIPFDADEIAAGSTEQTLQISFIACPGDRIVVTLTLEEFQVREEFLV